MTIPSPVSCNVCDPAAVYAVRTLVRSFAPAIGFDKEVTEELVVVVSELTSNILKYGKRGKIELSALDPAEGVTGISIAAEDETPPFDLTASIRDGCDSSGPIDPARVFGRGGIGAGLGAVARFSDRLELVPTASGKRIIARRAVSRPRRGSQPSF